jgi:hypothetical protein
MNDYDLSAKISSFLHMGSKYIYRDLIQLKEVDAIHQTNQENRYLVNDQQVSVFLLNLLATINKFKHQAQQRQVFISQELAKDP